MARGQSASFLRRMRRLHGLGEFSKKRRRAKRQPKAKRRVIVRRKSLKTNGLPAVTSGFYY